MIKEFNNLQDFDEAFPDEETCISHYRAIRWPNGIPCIHCGSMERIYNLPKGKQKCGDCRKTFTVRHGSIFADSKLSLRLWFKAIFLMTSHKKGISSHQLARDLGVTQKTGWFVLSRIREASKTPEFSAPLDGTIEMDEMFIGGLSKWKHKNKKQNSSRIAEKTYYKGDKKVVMGMLQRDGDLRFHHVKSIKGAVKEVVSANIKPGATVYTDEAAHYRWMHNNYHHNLVKHYLGEYVRGDVTTNRIEGAFGHFKRAVHGVYHKVSDEHLHRYLNMFAWRWNRRDMGEGERVNDLLECTKGKQITYRKLIRKEVS